MSFSYVINVVGASAIVFIFLGFVLASVTGIPVYKRMFIGLPKKKEKELGPWETFLTWMCILAVFFLLYWALSSWVRFTLDDVTNPNLIVILVAIIPWLLIITGLTWLMGYATAHAATSDGELRLRLASYHKKMTVRLRTEGGNDGVILTVNASGGGDLRVQLHEGVEEAYEKAEPGKTYEMYWDGLNVFEQPVIIGLTLVEEAKETSSQDVSKASEIF